MNPSERDPAPAVTRAVSILQALADLRGVPVGLSDLARTVGIAKSSAANICASLEEAGMIDRDGRGFRLGRRTGELGGAFAAQFNQIREFFAVCDHSEGLRNELVQIAMLDGADMLYLARHEGRASQRLGTPLGSRLPAAQTATGRAILMTRDEAEVRALVSDSLQDRAATDRSIRDIDSLLADLSAARERGYSIDDNASYPGVVGVAVPLPPWNPSDPPFALGVALATELADPAHIARVGAALLAAATSLTNPLLVAPEVDER